MKNRDEKRLLSCKEVAEIIGVSLGTLYNWRSDGTLTIPCVRINSKVIKYRYSEVRAWLDARTIKHE